jgi:microcystin-dependent protein
VYSLPSGYQAITGETIQASQHNPPLEDLASAMSARLMRSGVAPLTGPLKIVDGSVGSPAVKFSSDGTTGLYKTADGFGVSVGGDQVAEFTSDGISGVRFIGELIPYTGLTAQPRTVFPYGQTLSRTTYAALWAFAQIEISAGNSFYNNGNGTTTFGIGDCRGCVVAGKDDMGGTPANRLPSSGAVDGTVLGYVGGTDRHTLSAAQIPSITSSGSNSISVQSIQSGIPFSTSNTGSGQASTGTSNMPYFAGSISISKIDSTGNNSISVASNNTSGQAHNNVQPTIVGNFLLFAGA